MSHIYAFTDHENEVQYRVLGSKFYGIIFPSENQEVFEERLNACKKKYPDASHHCYAWRLDPFNLNEFSQDDGEPSGTAGLPILNVLRSFNCCNTGIIVVRYFGGTKLGKAGLIDAYGHTARLATESISLYNVTIGKRFTLIFDYEQKSHADQLLRKMQIEPHEATYLEKITYIVQIPEESAELFADEAAKLVYLGIQCSDGEPVMVKI